jgi:Spy/CpxP family protein refolding chaperone
MTDPRGGTTPVPPHSQRLVAGLVVALALVTGIIVGVAADRRLLLHRSGEPFMGRPGFGMHDGPRHGGPDRLAAELGLTPAQKTEIDSIMSRQMAAHRALQDSIAIRMHAAMDSTRAAVDRVLTPEQRQKLAAIRARRDSMRGPARDRRLGIDRPALPPERP